MMRKIALMVLLACISSLNGQACMSSDPTDSKINAEFATNLFKGMVFHSALHMGDLESDITTNPKGTSFIGCDINRDTYALYKLKTSSFYEPGDIVNFLMYIPFSFISSFQNLLASIVHTRYTYPWAKKDTSPQTLDRITTKLSPKYQSFMVGWTYKGAFDREFKYLNDNETQTLSLMRFFNYDLNLSMFLAIMDVKNPNGR